MKTAAFHTLGCKVNMYDTEALIALFEKADYDIINFNDKADVYVINTCTVTNLGDRKSRQMIRKAKRNNYNAIVIVTGCYAQTSAEQLEEIPEVDIIIGTKDRQNIIQYIDKWHETHKKINAVKNLVKDEIFEELSVERIKDKTRAFIKIQEGCNQFCSYCIIPYARGPVRSRQLQNIIDECKRVVSHGYKEIVLTGIHIASYGADLNDITLIEVLESLNSIPGLERIRLSSLEPNLLTNEFINKLASIDKICDHFHVSLQSGCNSILKKMNRKYTAEEYENIINNIKRNFPFAAITTDIMVGFPGESQTEFEESFNFVKKVDFSKLHVFKYSPRIGTPAADFSNQISPEIKELRSKEFLELSNILEEKFLSRFKDVNLEVIFEQLCKESSNWYQGHTRNYILVKVQEDKDIRQQTLDVLMKNPQKNYIVGNIIKE